MLDLLPIAVLACSVRTTTASLRTTPIVATTTTAPSPLALFTSEVCLQHNPGAKGKRPDGTPNLHPEQVDRLASLQAAMRGPWKAEFGSLLHVLEPEVDATEAQLLRVHTPQYLEFLQQKFAQSQRRPPMRVNLDRDTVISGGTQAAASRAAGLVIAAVDAVLSRRDDEPSRAFVMVRPPGHHAEAGRCGGFCIYNNVLVGVAHAQAMHGIGNVAILDFDVHHGNGDEEISWCDPTRLYASTHEEALWPGTGATRGCDGLHGQILSQPLPPHCGSEQFREVWRSEIFPVVREFRPDAVFLSAGFDAHADDPLASMQLTEADFEWITKEVTSLGLPVISVLEGGYNVEALESCVRAHVRALINS